MRHYEEVGLLPPAERSPGGFRLYTDAAVERLLVVMQMKPLEFSLEQMRELLDAVDELRGHASAERAQQLRQTLAEYREEVARRTRRLEERLVGARALDASLGALLA